MYQKLTPIELNSDDYAMTPMVVKSDGCPLATKPMIVTERVELPSQLWAHTLEFLPMKDVLNCSSIVDADLWKEVLPLIKVATVETTSDILYQRGLFPAVERIHIHSLTKGSRTQVKTLMNPCMADCFVSFLLSFPKLTYTRIAPNVYDDIAKVYVEEGWDSRYKYDFSSHVVRRICSAYSSGLLDDKVYLEGIIPQKGSNWRCLARSIPRSRIHPNGEGCGVCRLICKSFPPLQLLEGFHGIPRCMPLGQQMNSS